MNQNNQDLCVSFGDEKIIFDYDQNICFQTLIQQMSQNFNINEGSFKLVEIQRNARIISSRALDPRKEYRIELLSVHQNVFPVELNNSIEIVSQVVNHLEDLPNSQNSIIPQSDQIEPGKIDLSWFVDKKFTQYNLLQKTNEWAGNLKFKMAFSEGKKKTSEGFKRTVVCSIPNCKFKLVFASNLDEKEYFLNSKISNKYNVHSNFFISFSLSW